MDLTPIVLPVLVSVILSVAGAFVVARYSGPAQTQFIAALEGRLKIVVIERDEAKALIPRLEARIVQLEAEVQTLKVDASSKESEITGLYRRLDAAEGKIRRAGA